MKVPSRARLAVRRLILPALAVGLALDSLTAAPGAGGRRAGAPAPAPSPAAVDATAAAAGWPEVERLISEQKLEEAARLLAGLREAARQAGDEQAWARALVREVQLRTALHGYETAVRFLKEQPWPQGRLARVSLELFYARSLVHYVEAYGWEVRRRERVEARGPVDLTAWTADQIAGEALQAYERVWRERASLDVPLGRLAELIEPGEFPAHVRGTLRDAVSYLLVELLANTALWRPEHENGTWQLALPELLGEGGPRERALADTALHPLLRLASVLDDLEAWHRREGRREAALEAGLERVRRLRAALSGPAQAAALRAHLERRLAAERGLPWWSMGMAELAELVRDQDAPGALADARRIAAEGRQAHPGSPGAARCAAIVAAIEAPEYQMAAMSHDGARRPSIEITHRNLPVLYFRAWARDLVATVERSRDYDPLGTHRDLDELRAQPPSAEWRLELPATPDFRLHRTFAAPPLTRPGLYLIAASARADFAGQENQIVAASLVVTDLVVVSRSSPGGIHATTLSGATGQPRAGVEVSLYRFDWTNGHRRIAHGTTAADGTLQMTVAPAQGVEALFVLARQGADVALDSRYFHGQPEAASAGGALVYTDRSVYRPLQKVLWKVLAYRGGGAPGRLLPQAGGSITVQLQDANGEAVESRTVATNAFGSASGEFAIPPGRALGAWTVACTTGGSASIRVEEYKRPTFEVTFQEPEAALRLNRPARLRGAARYYFGLPLTRGQVRWRVVREPVWPWHWWMAPAWAVQRGGGRRSADARQTVAAGTAALEPDGGFALSFSPAADERASPDVTYRYTVSADVTDEGGETRSAARSFRLGTVAVEATVASEDAFFRAGQPIRLRVSRVDLDGAPRAGKGSWRLLALAQPDLTLAPAEQPLPGEAAGPERAFETPGDRQRPRWDHRYTPEAALAAWRDGEERARGSAEHDERGEAALVLDPLPPGAYRLRYETRDAFGAAFTTSKDLVVAGAEAPALKLPALLLAERSSVPVGSTARLLALSGLPGARLLVDVDRGGERVRRRLLDAQRDRAVIEIPVEEADRGGFAVTLTLVHDHQLVTLTQPVFVPWDDRELKVEFATFRDRLRPGGRESWRVSVRSGGPRPAEAAAAELLAYMYDRSLDAFAPHEPPSPLSLYPRLASAAPTRSSLGASSVFTLVSSLAVPFPPPLEGERLRFESGYAVGGMGRRESLALSLAADSAAAPPAQGPDGRRDGHKAGAFSRGAPSAPAPYLAQAGSAQEGAGAPAPLQLRADFSETAFWQPHLLTGPDGSAVLEFTVPDSVTSWKVWVHAVTRDLRAGSASREARSVKELMVRPYLPRFLREGDRAELKVVVNNASQAPLSGTLTVEVLDPDSGRSLNAAFGLPDAVSRPFSVAPGGGADLGFALAAPSRVSQAAFKVTARAGDLGDGELRPLPVLPGRLHLAQSRFAALRGAQRRTLHFADLARGGDPSLVHEQLVVTLDAQLFYGVLQALPYLIDYPYECSEQTLNRFLSTAILSSLFREYPAVARMAEQLAGRDTRLETWDATDPNRKIALEETPWLAEARGGADPGAPLIRVLDPRIARAERDASLAKLQKAQTALGAFPWWPGGPPSPYMTLYIVHGFAKSLEFGVEPPKEMTVKAWSYLHRHYLDEGVRWMAGEECCWELVTLINYVLSAYPDASWTGGVFTDAERRTMLDFSFRHWRRHSPYLKGYLALTLARAGRAADARLVFDSVMDSARTEEDLGTYWAPEDRAWLWYNDTVETHAFALRALMELRPEDPRRDGLVQWLFLDKKLNHWKSTRATAEAIYSLAHYLRKTGALGARESARVEVGGQTTTFAFEPDRYTGRANRIVVPGDKLDPSTAATVSVDKQGPGLIFASATWHFSTEALPEQERGDLLSVSRRYFRRDGGGGEAVLTPLAEGATLAPGDEVEVQLSVRAKHAAEYVHLRDPRPAGLEPGVAVSRFRWDIGPGAYEEVRDSATNFFFEQLPAGEYTLSYRLRANLAGEFRVGPATLQPMYAPEFTAYSSGARIRVSGGGGVSRVTPE